MYCVKETSKGLAFPSHIPCPRGHRGAIANLVAYSICSMSGCVFAKIKFLFLLSSMVSLPLILYLGEIVYRCCMLVEEVQHLKSRYKNSIFQLLREAFHMPWIRYTIFVLSLLGTLLIVFILHENPFNILVENGFTIATTLLNLLLLQKLLKLEKGLLHESLQFSELKCMDYGSGIAHSFFHGYLRIVLPHTGQGGNKGIKEFQKDFEARHQVQFGAYKLFILIPLSTNCPTSLNEVSSTIEDSKELESKQVDRAGVRKRDYKNSVYKIKTSHGRKIYVCAEYATPIKTLRDVMNENTTSANMYKKHHKEIILNFYITLLDLIKNDEPCKDLCEVIYYDDKDEQGDNKDVGKILLRRMNDIEKKMK